MDEEEQLAAAIALSLVADGGTPTEHHRAPEAESGSAGGEQDDAVSRFLAFTGTGDADAARAALAEAAGDVAMAVQRFFDGGAAAEDWQQTLSDQFTRAQQMLNTGDARGALAEWSACLTMARAHGHRAAQGAALGNLGNAHRSLGNYRKAIEYQEQALAIAVEMGDRQAQGRHLGNLGIAQDSLATTAKPSSTRSSTCDLC